ncbi:hypothetical protein [Embleya sp. NBC_00896]|uniref:hypothetical protein n=1 Tax=Embleya sp. NBC_00896 TaxID=2975961 RepID=UPI0038634DE9|nr:hypothetical protein OG928_32230 [Embleya sp. NBC_00896]
MTDVPPPGNPGADRSPLDFALQWAQLPPEHLQIALAALEPELARRHDLKRLEAELRAQERQNQRSHRLLMSGLWMGLAIVLAMLGCGAYVGLNDHPWLAAMFAGPSVPALATLFVLRQNDKTLTQALVRSNNAVLGALQGQSSPGNTPAGGAIA